MENMELWNKHSVTDPSHTKHVKQRGGFTAIDAHYQIQTATEEWGPFGTGWGVDNERFTPMDGGLLLYQAIMWYGNDRETFIPLHSSIVAVKDGRPDGDCVKKVATDALTKGLSKLGFNADVFLGRFDANKYVGKAGKEDIPIGIVNLNKEWYDLPKNMEMKTQTGRERCKLLADKHGVSMKAIAEEFGYDKDTPDKQIMLEIPKIAKFLEGYKK